MDQFKGRSIEEISAELDLKGSRLEIAIENLERDFNMERKAGQLLNYYRRVLAAAPGGGAA